MKIEYLLLNNTSRLEALNMPDLLKLVYLSNKSDFAKLNAKKYIASRVLNAIKTILTNKVW